jgi:4-hydroxybenzoate polyprenyltransferase
VCVFLFITGREYLMDIHDIPGDHKCGLRTLPMHIGTRLISIVAGTAMLAGSILLISIARTAGSLALSGIVVSAIASSAVIAGLAVRASWHGLVGRQLIYFCWLPITLGLIVFMNS